MTRSVYVGVYLALFGKSVLSLEMYLQGRFRENIFDRYALIGSTDKIFMGKSWGNRAHRFGVAKLRCFPAASNRRESGLGEPNGSVLFFSVVCQPPLGNNNYTRGL